jgi:hypothetical protein
MRARIAKQMESARRVAITAGVWAVIAVLVLFAPHTVLELLALLVGIAGALAVWAASQPLVLTFAAGAYSGWRAARRRRGWAT